MAKDSEGSRKESQGVRLNTSVANDSRPARRPTRTLWPMPHTSPEAFQVAAYPIFLRGLGMDLGEIVQENPRASYYRARYYDPSIGRFVAEDPIRFGGGADFYRYVFNNPARLTDSNGLSSRDVQRIMEACKKCTKAMSDQGRRLPGSGVPMGWLNDFTYWFSKKRESCYGQAQLAQPCL